MIIGIRLNDSNREKWNSERRTKLIELMRQQLRKMHYNYRTEKNYTMWVEKFLRFHRDADGR